MECGYLEKVWPTLTPEDIDDLQHAADALYHAGSEEENVFELWQFNIQFHLSLIALAHNKYAYETLSSAMKFLQRAYGQFYWERQRSIISLKHPERHDRILQAMRSRDLEQAKDCLREDIVAFTLF